LTSNARLEIRLTQSQMERLKQKAMSEGYKTISQYVRNKLLENSISTEKMLSDIYNSLIEKGIIETKINSKSKFS
jgi:uncharacterized protein (DUF1778 family)